MPNSPNRLDTLQNLRYANIDAAFATAFATLVSGAFLVGFVKLLGGGDMWIGLLTALPSALGVLQIPGAIFARRFPSYKRFVLPGGLVWRLMYIPIALLPLLALSGQLTLFLLTALTTVAAIAILLVNSTYNDWLAEIVPPNSRGWYFARRGAIATATGAVAGIAGGAILDAFKERGSERLGYAVVFGLGVVCAAVSFYWYMRMKDLQRANPVRQSVRAGIAAFGAPFADRKFRKVLVLLAFLVLGQTFAGNLYTEYALETLKLPFRVIQGAGMMQALGIVVASGLWGFLSDKYGNKPCLILAGLGIATNPIAWIITKPNALLFNSLVLFPAHIFMGLFWAGVSLTQFNIVLATARPADRANYIGASLAVQGLVGGIAPIIGASMMLPLRGAVGAEHAFKWVFLTAGVLRIVAVLFLAPVREEGSSRVKTTLQDLRRITPRGFMAMRSLAKSSDVAERAVAIENVGTEGFALAGDELVKALHDPSPKIRRQAAASLAQLHDPNAAEALVHQLVEHPDLVEEETVEALGELGSASAVKPLIGLLRSPKSLLRRAAVKALGRLGSSDAIEALTEAAGEVSDPELRRASIRALRILGADGAGPVIYDALFDPHPSVRIAAAEAVAELDLKDALPYVRQSLAYYEDEATSEVTYALGCVGTLDDVPMILGEAKKTISIITRRRCLLGLARLLGVESESYRIMLLEELNRDNYLMEILKPHFRANRRLRSAFDRFTGGDDKGALEQLEHVWPEPLFKEFAGSSVEELFLVAVLAGIHRSGSDRA